MIKVYSSNNPNQAIIIKQMLEENGINVVLLNKQDSSYLMFGPIELYVHEEEIIQAKKLLEN
tara:strand:+ start:1943 stop:2128 length:186 start_codon:yes stop_codon:yes gene_type:complete